MARTVTIRRSLLTSLGLLVLGLALAIFAITVVTSREIVRAASGRVLSRALERSTAELSGFFDPVEHSLELASLWLERGRFEPEDDDTLEAFFQPLLETYPQISSVSIADVEGRSWMLLQRPDGWMSRRGDPPRTGHGLVFREWDGGTGEVRTRRVADPVAEQRYDPRTRAWYEAAVEGAAALEPDVELPKRVYWTDPYAFFTTGEPGITATAHARTADGRRFLIAFDVLLRDVSDFTQRLEVSANGFVAILTADRRLIGLPRHPRLADPDVRAAALLKLPRELGISVFDDAAAARRAVPDPEIPQAGRDGLFSFRSGGEVYWADGVIFSVPFGRRFIVVVTMPERDLLGPVMQLRKGVFGVTLVALAAAVLSAFQLARRYSRPLSALASNSSRIRRLDLRTATPVESGISEIAELSGAQEGMRRALDAFSRYVPTDVVRELLELGEAAQIGGERKTLTVMFSDIQGFTRISEGKSPEELTHHLAIYFEEMLSIIDEVGTVDKLIGDGIMAFWGAPYPDPHHARHAVEAVIGCEARLESLNARWQGAGEPPLPTRFGLASGPALVGNVGSARRLSYTAVGDVVNLASRLEGLNRLYGTRVLAADPVPGLAGEQFLWRRIDQVRVVGRRQSAEVSELLGEAGEVPAERMAFAARYEEGLGLYRARAWSEAAQLLAELPKPFHRDVSVRHLRSTCARLIKHPPGPDWEPITILDQK